jgi:hypothetical protein
LNPTRADGTGRAAKENVRLADMDMAIIAGGGAIIKCHRYPAG